MLPQWSVFMALHPIFSGMPDASTLLTEYSFLLQKFLIVGPTLFLLKAPCPPSDNEKKHLSSAVATRFDNTVFRKPRFVAMSYSNLLQGLVFYLPTVFIPGRKPLDHQG
jgi:hypothetical protein